MRQVLIIIHRQVWGKYVFIPELLLCLIVHCCEPWLPSPCHFSNQDTLLSLICIHRIKMCGCYFASGKQIYYLCPFGFLHFVFCYVFIFICISIRKRWEKFIFEASCSCPPKVSDSPQRSCTCHHINWTGLGLATITCVSRLSFIICHALSINSGLKLIFYMSDVRRRGNSFT